jgi:tetratricopeptide (TPR) repeat protein
MPDEAVRVAVEGLKHHPELVSGHLALAKAYLAKGERLRAKDEAVTILSLMPGNIEALAVLELAGSGTADGHSRPPIGVEGNLRRNDGPPDDEDITEDMPLAEVKEDAEETASVSDFEAWHTLTMAQILARQGHFARARRIFKKILDKEPENEKAKEELNKLE